MIPGIPEKANIKEPITKKLVYEKFGLSAKDRNLFDKSVHKMAIVGEISERTVTITPGQEINRFFIIEVQLQSKNYDKKSIALLFKLIPQKIILILRTDTEYKLAVFKEIMIEGDWDRLENLLIDLKGINLDAVWENIVKNIGNIEIREGITLSDQIIIDEQIRKINVQISTLMDRMHREKQPRKKHELYEQIQKLEEQKSSLI